MVIRVGFGRGGCSRVDSDGGSNGKHEVGRRRLGRDRRKTKPSSAIRRGGRGSYFGLLEMAAVRGLVLVLLLLLLNPEPERLFAETSSFVRDEVCERREARCSFSDMWAGFADGRQRPLLDRTTNAARLAPL